MHIDWITTAAQIANFMILLWLLNRFLYRPLIDAIDAREVSVQSAHAKAEEIAQHAEAERKALAEERQTLAAQREAALESARRDADTIRKDARADARKEIAAQKAAIEAGLNDDRREAAKDIAHTAAAALTRIAKRALTDLAGVDLSGRMLAAFADALKELDPVERDRLKRASERHGLMVETAETVSPAAERRLRQALASIGCDGKVPVFETDKSLGSGVLLRAGSLEMAWTVDAYLEGFEQALVSSLQGQEERQANAEFEDETPPIAETAS